MSGPPPAATLRNRPFVLLCLATFFFYLGFQMLARWGYRSMWLASAVIAGIGAAAAARHITRARG